jgi:hypothetical protein
MNHQGDSSDPNPRKNLNQADSLSKQLEQRIACFINSFHIKTRAVSAKRP